VGKRVEINVSYGAHNEFLHQCYLGNAEEVTKLLIANGNEQVNQPDPISKTTPLHEAASRGLEVIVKILLAHSANVYARDCNGDTPVHLAIRNHHDKVAIMILNHAASYSSKPFEAQKALGVLFGDVPMDVATKITPNLPTPTMSTSSSHVSDSASSASSAAPVEMSQTQSEPQSSVQEATKIDIEAVAPESQSKPVSSSESQEPQQQESQQQSGSATASNPNPSTEAPAQPVTTIPSVSTSSDQGVKVQWPILLWDVPNIEGETPSSLARARGGIEAGRYAHLETAHRAMWNAQASDKLGLVVDETQRVSTECCETCAIA